LSLDLAHQQSVSALVNARRTDEQTAVIFVTHEINPILPFVDRVLYLVGGRSAIGSAGEIFTSERLSALYDTPIDVLDVRGRIVVVGGDDGFAEHGHHHHVQEH
jgi:zinc/manganese transport system ATP-binding protein